MNHQIMESNGQTIEQKNGKTYVNGVNIETGNLKPTYYFGIGIFSAFTFAIGYFVGILL